MKEMWKFNAMIVEGAYCSQVDWEEKFYICPECGEPIYECDWTSVDLVNEICPICGFVGDEED